MKTDKGNWFCRFIIDDDGMESMEIGFTMGLIAAIVGLVILFTFEPSGL